MEELEGFPRIEITEIVTANENHVFLPVKVRSAHSRACRII
jgi:hypothetical protein